MKPIEMLMNSIEWTPAGGAAGVDGLPYATHFGVLEIGAIKLRCYRLNDGRSIIDADDMEAFFGDVLGDMPRGDSHD